MRLAKSLLCAAAVFTLAIGTAVAGEGFTMHEPLDRSVENSYEPLDRSVENSLPQLEGSSLAMNDASVESSPPVIFVYPIEVTEYYWIVPSESSEMPG